MLRNCRLPRIACANLPRGVAAALLMCVSVASAQDTAGRLFIDSVFRDIGRAKTSSELPAATRCDGRSGSLQRLCQGLLFAKRAEFTLAVGDADKAEQLLSRVANEEPDWPMGWYGLAIARLQMGRANMVSREGPLSPVGVSLEAGAGYALVRALELDSTFQEAVEALALAPVPREGAARLGERLAMLERLQRLLPGPARYATGMLELEANHPEKAVTFLEEALNQRGIDSGVVQLALARARYGTGEPELGRAALFAGATDTSELTGMAYRREISWVASPAELVEWDSLPAGGRADWLRAFWARRDVQDARPDGARLIEHYRRMEYALSAYRMVLPRSGRNKAAGQASTVDWFAEEMLQRHPEDYDASPDVADRAMTAQTIGASSPFHAFRTSQALLDDRGAAYIRHGKPDEIARTKAGIAVELWKYERPGDPLLLGFTEVDFDGQVGASRMVPSLLSISPQLRDQLCHLDTRLCSSSADPTAPNLIVNIDASNVRSQTGSSSRALAADRSQNSVSRLQESRRKGIETVNIAMSTDDYPRKFTHEVHPVVQVYGLDRASGGEPRLVVAFAIPGEELDYATPPAAGGRAVYPVEFHVMATRQADGWRVELDTLRQFAVPRPLTAGEFITGMIEMKVPAGIYSSSVLVSQADGRGAVASVMAVATPRAEPVLQVSDLVLGQEKSPVHWNSGSYAVPLNPLNAFPKGGTAEVYYQLWGLKVGTSYDSRFEFYKAEETDKPAKLRLAFKEQAPATHGEVKRSLGLANLDPGQYQVRFVISGGGLEASAISWLTIASK
jgi:hypothetical protein